MDKDKKCWMCDTQKDLKEGTINDNVERVVNRHEEDDYLVIVPRDPLVEGHVLIVLKNEKDDNCYGQDDHDVYWNNVSVKNLAKLNEAVVEWRKKLKKFYDCKNVFQTCLCDKEPHLHYHLFPTDKKGWKGKGHIWLGVQEAISLAIDEDKKAEMIKNTKSTLRTSPE